MKAFGLCIAACLSSAGYSKAPEPVIDVHMHALPVDEQGPPPMGMCTPSEQIPVWDQRRPFGEIFQERFKKPPCKDPV